MKKAVLFFVKILPDSLQIWIERACCRLISTILNEVEITYRGYRVVMPAGDQAAAINYFRYLLTRDWHHEIYEQQLVGNFLGNNFGGCVFIDGGANHGMYALLAASIPSVQRIYAIEASPRTYATLEQNVRLNGLFERVFCLNNAISSSSGERVYITDTPVNSEQNAVSTRADGLEGARPVETLALDDLLLNGFNSQIESVFIKMDIEGNEPGALEGLQKLIDSRRNFIIMLEFHAGVLDATELTAKGFGEILWNRFPSRIIEVDSLAQNCHDFASREEFLTRIDSLSHQSFPANIRNLMLFSSQVDKSFFLNPAV